MYSYTLCVWGWLVFAPALRDTDFTPIAIRTHRWATLFVAEHRTRPLSIRGLALAAQAASPRDNNSAFETLDAEQVLHRHASVRALRDKPRAPDFVL